jgi:N-acetyl sugar amidotransferase
MAHRQEATATPAAPKSPPATARTVAPLLGRAAGAPSSPVTTPALEPRVTIVPFTPPRTDVRYCTRCLYDETTPAITFDDDGVCNYCRLHDQLDRAHPTGPEGRRRLEAMASEIRAAGRGKPYDVAIGVSGGCDSSYLLYLAKDLGLRPLAVHYDNTWDSRVAVENIDRMLKALNVELFTIVVDNEEYDEIYRSFLLAGVPDIDAATDIGLAATLYIAAERFGIRYTFEGHSFRTEGVSPIDWCYMDGKYIESVVRQYSGRRLKTFPNLTLGRFLRWMILRRIKRIRPLYHVDYHKEQTKRFLAENFGWQWYGGHHLENRFAAFSHSYFFPLRYGVDQRRNGYAALVRSGQMSRAEGLQQLCLPPYLEDEILTLIKKRLRFSDEEFERIMTRPKRTYRDFKTYKPTFERLRPLFWLMAELELVPRSFYVKYTSKNNI